MKVQVLIFGVICIVLHHHTMAAPTTTTSHNLFADDLFSILTEGKSMKNIVYSPASIQTCLAFAFTGADGETAEEMRHALHLGAGDKTTVAQNYGEFLKSSFHTPKEDGPVLKMANRFYVNQNLKIANEFQTISKEFFDASAENVNFANSAETAKHINHWVEQQTENKIKDLFNEAAFDGDTSVVLVNAIYFKARWENTFSNYSTKDSTFHMTSEKHAQVKMMAQNDRFNYVELPEYDAKALEMKYDNSDLSMLVILPNEIEGLAKLESQLKGVDFNDITSKMSSMSVDVYFPKFRIEVEMELNEPLKKMGMTTMFSQVADFSHLFDSSAPQMVSDVVHKAFLDVDEDGSEAAAATFWKAVPSSLVMNPKEFRADHPFVFAIRSKTAVFFAGHLAKF